MWRSSRVHDNFQAPSGQLQLEEEAFAYSRSFRAPTESMQLANDGLGELAALGAAAQVAGPVLPLRNDVQDRAVDVIRVVI